MFGFVTSILTHSGGILDLNPAQKAEFKYASELKQARGFNPNSGILQVTRSCVASETASLMIESTDISWSFIQAALGYAAADSTTPYQWVEHFTPPASAVSGGNTTITLGNTPQTGGAFAPKAVNAETGVAIPISVSGTTGTLTGAHAGQRITVSYWINTAKPQIAVGSGVRLTGLGIVGLFKACDESILLQALNCSLAADFTLTADEGVAASSVTVDFLTDSAGNLCTLTKIA